MFDSAFDDWLPGKPVLFGLPLHGRLDGKGIGGGGGITLSLPNAATLNLPGAFYDGGLTRFRDPRAVDIERSPEDLAADLAAGREWRSEALMGEGQASLLRIDSAYGWVYHTPEQNYFVAWSGGAAVYLLPTPTIARDSSDPAQRISITAVRVGQPGTATPEVGPGGLSAGGGLMSTSLSGDHALFGSAARVLNYDKAAPGKSMLGVWELRLSGLTAEYELIRSAEQCAGVVTIDPYPVVTGMQTRVTWGWEKIDEKTWNSTIRVRDEILSGQNRSSFFVNDRDNWQYHLTGQIVSMYYGSDGQPKEICLDVLVDESYPRSGGSYVESETAAVAFDPNGDAIHATQARFVSGGDYSYSGSESAAWRSVTTISLVDAGAARSQCVIDKQQSMSRHINSVTQYTADANGWMNDSPSVGTSTSTYSRTARETVTLDGKVLSDLSTAFSDSNSYYHAEVTWAPFPPGSYLQAWTTYSGQWDIDIEHYEYSGHGFAVGVGGYSPQLLSLVVGEVKPASPESVAWHFGGAIHQGGMTPGYYVQHGAAISGLYGAYNPITGEVVRDSLTPVSFV